MHVKPKYGKIGLLSATFIGISSMIGSGWLFAPYVAAKIAGGGSLVAWVIGAAIVFLLGMVFSEIAGLYPRRGLSAIVPTLSHNMFYGFPFALANWLGIVAVIALEASASIEYLIEIFPQYDKIFFLNEALTIYGQMIAVVLILFYSILNFWGASLLTKANNVIVVFKLVVPLMTAILVIYSAYTPSNFVAHGGFFANGVDSVLTAVLAAGIVVAFNGFQTIISFSSEIENPHRNIPLSIGISIAFSLIIYMLLQTSFIGALPADMLKNGWQHLDFTAPMVQLTALVGLNFMTLILYSDAIVSPTGTAITFVGASTRMFTAMARNRQMPKFFDHVDPVIRVSRRSLILNVGLAILFLLVFKSWTELAQILGLLHIISYLSAPVALVVFRREIREEMYFFKMTFGRTISLFLFIFFSYLFTMATFKVALDMIIILGVFQLVFIVVSSSSLKDYKNGFIKSSLIYAYLASLIGLTYISPNNQNMLSQLEFTLLAATISAVAFFALSRLHINKNIHSELHAISSVKH
ncbi:MAG: APC family permease [Campylobacterota bacterium]|nr:APC family permease [Campylobacterota bacterium]